MRRFAAALALAAVLGSAHAAPWDSVWLRVAQDRHALVDVRLVLDIGRTLCAQLGGRHPVPGSVRLGAVVDAPRAGRVVREVWAACGASGWVSRPGLAPP